MKSTFFPLCVPTQVKYRGGENNPRSIQYNIIDIKAAAKNRLQQFNCQRCGDSRDDGLFPRSIFPEQGIKNPKGEVHYNISQIFRAEVLKKIWNKVILKIEPGPASSACAPVKEEIVRLSHNIFKQGQTQQSGDIADKQRGQDRVCRRTDRKSVV